VADVAGMVAPDYRTGHQGLVVSPTRARIVAESERIAAVRRSFHRQRAGVLGVRSLTIRHERLIALSSRLT
jgi:hypothetical protein